ncbi:MAG: recombination mediator RecR [Lentisphaeria bacterium]
MIVYPECVQHLINSFRRFPGVGMRSAERMALSLLNWKPELIEQLANQIHNLPVDIKFCTNCGGFSDDELCHICTNMRRNQRLICLVENPSQIGIFEQNGGYNGVYHVLGGKLKPLDGVGPDELHLERLIRRVEENDVDEIIVALGSDVEGAATGSFIASLFGEKVIVSGLATGIPLGLDISYADSGTISAAISHRYRL